MYCNRFSLPRSHRHVDSSSSARSRLPPSARDRPAVRDVSTIRVGMRLQPHHIQFVSLQQHPYSTVSGATSGFLNFLGLSCLTSANSSERIGINMFGCAAFFPRCDEPRAPCRSAARFASVWRLAALTYSYYQSSCAIGEPPLFGMACRIASR